MARSEGMVVSAHRPTTRSRSSAFVATCRYRAAWLTPSALATSTTVALAGPKRRMTSSAAETIRSRVRGASSRDIYLRRGGNSVQLLQDLRRERQPPRGKVLAQMGYRRCARDQQDVGRALQ